MSRSLKESIIITLITLVIAAVSLIFPKIVNATHTVGQGNTKDISDFKVGNSEYISKDDLVDNKNIFCTEHGVNSWGNDWYKISKKVELKANGELYVDGVKLDPEEDGATISAMIEVFKILAYNEEENLKVCNLSAHKTENIGLDYRHTDTVYEKEPYNMEKYGMNLTECARQEFLWHCLKSHETILTAIFGSIGDEMSNHCWHYNPNSEYEDKKLNPFTLTDDKGVSDYSKMINWDKTVCGTIYILSNAYKQNFLVTDAKVVDTPTIQVTFKKTDISGSNVLGGAEIEITANDNVSMDKVTLESSSTDGIFGTIEVTPTENTGKFALNIKETKASSSYNRINGGNSVVLTVEYDPDDGTIDFMSVDKCTGNFVFDNNTVTVTLKNDSRVISDLNVYKKDTKTEEGINEIPFNMYFNNVTYVKIGTHTYYAKDVIDHNKIVTLDDGSKYYKKTANGLELLVPTKETVGSEDYKNRLYIKGLKTDTIDGISGKIKIDKIEAIQNTDTVYVTVTEPGNDKRL